MVERTRIPHSHKHTYYIHTYICNARTADHKRKLLTWRKKGPEIAREKANAANMSTKAVYSFLGPGEPI